MQCSKCNNELKVRRIPRRNVGPYGITVWERETYCPYCEWKGDSGIGKEFKELISKINKGA